MIIQTMSGDKSARNFSSMGIFFSTCSAFLDCFRLLLEGVAQEAFAFGNMLCNYVLYIHELGSWNECLVALYT